MKIIASSGAETMLVEINKTEFTALTGKDNFPVTFGSNHDIMKICSLGQRLNAIPNGVETVWRSLDDAASILRSVAPTMDSIFSDETNKIKTE